MKEFVTAAEETIAEDEGSDGSIQFLVDGWEVTAYKPGDGQLAVLMATTGRHSDGPEQMAGIINFFASVLDDASHSHLVKRLLDRRDPYGVEQVTETIEWLIEEWSGGRPTKSPSASSQSPKRAGQKSKQNTPALT